VGLERGPLNLVSTTEELLGRKSSGSGLETENIVLWIRCAIHPLSAKVGTNFADWWRSLFGKVRSRTQATELYFKVFIVICREDFYIFE
jgi:hypothetical protein